MIKQTINLSFQANLSLLRKEGSRENFGGGGEKVKGILSRVGEVTIDKCVTM